MHKRSGFYAPDRYSTIGHTGGDAGSNGRFGRGGNSGREFEFVFEMKVFQGSGKTLAFGIPIVAGLLELQEQHGSDDTKKENAGGPKALILTPTRELAVQIKEHLLKILSYTPFRVRAAILNTILKFLHI